MRKQGFFAFVLGLPPQTPRQGGLRPPAPPDGTSLRSSLGWVGWGGASLRSPGLPFGWFLPLGLPPWPLLLAVWWSLVLSPRRPPLAGCSVPAVASLPVPAPGSPCTPCAAGFLVGGGSVFLALPALPRSSGFCSGGSCRVFLASGGVSLASAGVPAPRSSVLASGWPSWPALGRSSAVSGGPSFAPSLGLGWSRGFLGGDL